MRSNVGTFQEVSTPHSTRATSEIGNVLTVSDEFKAFMSILNKCASQVRAEFNALVMLKHKDVLTWLNMTCLAHHYCTFVVSVLHTFAVFYKKSLPKHRFELEICLYVQPAGQ